MHEQVIKLVDNMVQNYLGNVRRTVQRVTNLLDQPRVGGGGTGTVSQPTEAQIKPQEAPGAPETSQVGVRQAGERIVGELEGLTKRFREFTLQWSKTMGKQQSPLIDRIPPRGVELWRDFWDTVRRQVRRINEEVWQLTRDMGRVLTGRLPSTGGRIVIRPSGREGEQGGEGEAPATGGLAGLLYSAQGSAPTTTQTRDQNQEAIRQQFEEFYEKLSAQLAKEQQRMNELTKPSSSNAKSQQQQQQLDQNLIDELDDESTRQELANNVALRQQIQQEINVFGSIFDIMRTFISRLRDSASTIRDILTPPGAIFDNNPVTPGPAVKPTVDKLLEETINSQRNINSQARPTSRD